jgi:microcystin-dependent protein
MNTMRRIAVLSVILCSISGICMAQAANGLEVNADGTLAPITVKGDITTTGNVKAADGYGYVPIGTIVAWYCANSTTKPPKGWEKCDGQEIVTGTTPAGVYLDSLDGEKDSKFKVPELNPTETKPTGKFLRGGKKAGTYETATIKNHAHGIPKSQAVWDIVETNPREAGAPISKDNNYDNNLIWYARNEERTKIGEVTIGRWSAYQAPYSSTVVWTYTPLDYSIPESVYNYAGTDALGMAPIVEPFLNVNIFDFSGLNIPQPKMQMIASTANSYDFTNSIDWTDNFHTQEDIGSETRPVNMSVIWIIRVE